MLVENPALLLPSASCFCQIGLTTVILTSEALGSSFIWQKLDVVRTDAERRRGGRHLLDAFCPKVSGCSFRKHGNQVGVRSSGLSGGPDLPPLNVPQILNLITGFSLLVHRCAAHWLS